ncbi:MAG TPA: sigma-70 family RNA polymerase sigma factor [Planctomycetota bacterium]|nr:sigma-70 family RNA polymerase sigma factor [Planctomycetota bacterium]
MHQTDQDPELLLAHADFVRALARSLVRGDGEDLAQDAWTRVLRHPPAGEVGRSWFAQVVRRLASNRHRDERRRLAREAAVRTPEPQPSPEQVLAREEVRTRVVHAVLRLDEPFRTAVLLRYYDGLSAAQVARKVGLPAATVRTRLLRGLERLRVELDREHGGDRAAWAGALLPWTGPAQHLLMGTFVMSKNSLLGALAFALLFAIAWTAWQMFRVETAASPGAVAVAAASAVADAEDRERMASPPPAAARDARTQVTPPAPPDAASFPAERGLAELTGVVVDSGGRPVPGARVALRPFRGPLPAGLPVADDRSFARDAATDGAGTFRFEDVPEGPCSLTARDSDGCSATVVTALSAGRPEQTLLQLDDEPREADEVIVRVCDAAGHPQAGARIEGIVATQRGTLRGTGDEPPLQALTDEHGVARFVDEALIGGAFFARTADGQVGFATMLNDQREVVVTVGAAGSVLGRLTGADPAQLGGAEVRLHAVQTAWAYGTAIGRSFTAPVQGDTFTFGDLPAGTYGVTIACPTGLRLDVEPMKWGAKLLANSVTMRTLEVHAGATTEVELRVVPGASIAGSVRDGAGVPVIGARVCAVLAPATSNFPDGFVLRGAHVWRLDGPYDALPHGPQSHLLASTGSDGRYELRGLPPGSYRVEVTADRLSLDRRYGVVAEVGSTAELEHVLQPAGVLQVATRAITYLGVAPPDRPDEPVLLAVVHHGIGTFPGLAAGRWSVVAYHSDLRVDPRPLADVEIVAGRTTWSDLRDASDMTTITGHVLAGGQPVAGALVKWYPCAVRTDAQGAYTLRLGYRVRQCGNRAMDPNFTVVVDGVAHQIEPDDLRAGAPHVVQELQLGEHELVLHAQQRPGNSGPVKFQVRGGNDELPARRSCHVDATLIAATGELRVAYLPAGEYRVTAHFPSGAITKCTCTVPAVAPLLLDEPPHGTLTVRVVDANGMPLPRRSVTVLARPGPAPTRANATGAWNEDGFWNDAFELWKLTDLEGVATFEGVCAGQLRITVAPPYQSSHEVNRRAELAPDALLELRIEAR